MDQIVVMSMLMLIDDVSSEIGDLFSTVFGSQLLLGIFIFIFFFIFTLLLGLGMLVGSTIIIPAMFVVFEFVPSFAIIVGIVLGLLFGLGMNRLVRR